MTQMNLGSALFRASANGRSDERLEQAVAAFQLARHEYTRERVPLLWAATPDEPGRRA